MVVKNRKEGKSSSSSQQQQQQQQQQQKQQGKKEEKEWGDWLFEPIDAKPMALLRIFFGCVLIMEIFSFIAKDFAKADHHFFNLQHHLPYYGFQWFPELSLTEAHALLWVCLIASIGVTIGFLYHISMVVFCLGFGFVYFYEASTYLNHLYLTLIICSTFAILPCNARYSVDAYIFPSVYSKTVPRWTRLILEILLTCVYGHASQAKFNRDWLRGEPLRHWLPKRVKYLGPLMGQESFAYFISYSGLVYDAIAAPLLIFPATRPFGIFCNVFFHLTNKLIFNIGIFPWMMLSFLVLFIDLDFIDSIEATIKQEDRGAVKKGKVVQKRKKAGRGKKTVVVIVLVVFTLFHTFFPLRHHFYPGYVAWNEYGHLYSWRMKLRDKNCDIHDIWATFPDTGRNFSVYKIFEREFSPRQVSSMRSRPDFLSFGAHKLSESVQRWKRTDQHIPIFMDVQCQLNFGPLTQFTNPDYDMASHETFNWPYPWLMPEPEFPEKLYKDYPWNFEWTFSWVTTFPTCHLSDNNPLYDKGYRS